MIFKIHITKKTLLPAVKLYNNVPEFYRQTCGMCFFPIGISSKLSGQKSSKVFVGQVPTVHSATGWTICGTIDL